MNIENAIKIDGWMSIPELHWLAQQAKNAKRIIEVGCFKGRTTRVLADNTEGIVYCIDTWRDKYYQDNGEVHPYINPAVFNEFHDNLKDHIDSGKIIPCIGRFKDFFDYNDRADFIFIDADHRYEQVIDDILAANFFLSRPGIIAGHDYTHSDWPGVKRAVDIAFGNKILKGPDSIWYANL